MTTTTKTAALRKARAESSMYRQGRGWVVSHRDDRAQANRLGHEEPYRSAAAYLTRWRAMRAAELLGLDPLDVGEAGPVRDRLQVAIEVKISCPKGGGARLPEPEDTTAQDVGVTS